LPTLPIDASSAKRIKAGRQQASQMADAELRPGAAGAVLFIEPEHSACQVAFRPGTKTCRNRRSRGCPALRPKTFARALKGACRNQPASRASQMGIDGSLLSAGAKTRPGPKVVSVGGMEGWRTTI
jgi:hypothetical protein